MNCMLRVIFLVATASLMTSGAAWAGERARGQPAPAPPAFEACRAIVRVSGSGIGVGGPLEVKIYLSDVMPREPINDEDIRVAFEKFLKNKYGFDGVTQCIPPGPRAGTESYLRNLIEQDRKTRTMQGAAPQIVQTGWTY